MPFVLANVLQPIINVFEQVLLFFHDQIGVGWGFSIIMLTITVRAILLPLTFKQFKGMQAMQRLAPEMKRLQEKYKDDRQRLNQEMMKFYSENKVNPLASCLPLVAQMPVFISLFYMLRKDLKDDICNASAHLRPGQQIANAKCEEILPGSAHFLFIHDLTAAATGGVLVLLIVLYVGSQLLSSVLMSTTVDKNQRRIMLALPFVFVFFIINFPAGLLVYWITTNIWTVGQQYFVRRSVGMAVPGRPAREDLVPIKVPKDDGGLPDGSAPKREKVGVSGKAAPEATSGSARLTPPPPPRKKKKRSGRRR
jgi:YidC/Oxa1 family membrane protein insertase